MLAALRRWTGLLWGERALQSRTVAMTGGDEHTVPWVTVYVAANPLEAEVVRGRLASEDIPVVLRGEAVATVYGLTQGPLAAVDVLVPEPLVDRARQVLASAEADAAVDE